jgi:hypothetical protein
MNELDALLDQFLMPVGWWWHVDDTSRLKRVLARMIESKDL